MVIPSVNESHAINWRDSDEMDNYYLSLSKNASRSIS